ncbi:hypothetical protein R5H30_02415 [Sulfitobacter sp. D35]|uniref:hypothetical protein n=1 Tax=Sulfitobacter sp. D35 TaxID=3083252 RepID=UPI00296EA008|nr:hypothetical protein [Sulfitobacter sp. D35]MDW4496820.1 hypothetical protein [Sulfitobacter sp. D35]
MTQASPDRFTHHVYPFDDLETVFRRIDARISAIEKAANRLETELAVAEEKRKLIEQRFNQVDSRLDRIDGHVARLVWLIFAGLIGGMVSFLMEGGPFGG